MNKLFLVIGLFAILVADVMAQNYSQGSPDNKDWVYIPRRYNAIAATGDSLISAKIADINTTDTVNTIILAGWSQVHLVLAQATGTAGGLTVSYQGSTDGQSYGTNFILFDSLNWTAATAKKSFDLTSRCGGFYSVRLLIKGSTGPAFTGINTYTAYIRKKK
jgi:hypothetical protein